MTSLSRVHSSKYEAQGQSKVSPSASGLGNIPTDLRRRVRHTTTITTCRKTYLEIYPVRTLGAVTCM